MTSTSSGTWSRKRVELVLAHHTVPVGLFGVQTSTRRVPSVIARAIASRSCGLVGPQRHLHGGGAGRSVMDRVGLEGPPREEHLVAGPALVSATCCSSPTDPVPSARCSRGTEWRSDERVDERGRGGVRVAVRRAGRRRSIASSTPGSGA